MCVLWFYLCLWFVVIGCLAVFSRFAVNTSNDVCGL